MSYDTYMETKKPPCYQAYDHLLSRLPKELVSHVRDVVANIVEHEIRLVERRHTQREYEAIELLMKGEALREKMLLDSIVNGAFDNLTRSVKAS